MTDYTLLESVIVRVINMLFSHSRCVCVHINLLEKSIVFLEIAYTHKTGKWCVFKFFCSNNLMFVIIKN